MAASSESINGDVKEALVFVLVNQVFQEQSSSDLAWVGDNGLG